MSLVRRQFTQLLRPALYNASRAASTHAAKGASAEADPVDVARGLSEWSSQGQLGMRGG